MPGVGVDEIGEEGVVNHVNEIVLKPKGELVPESCRNGGGDGGEEVIDTSIEKLYENVFEMQISHCSPSGPSFASDEVESRIDSELRHLAGGEVEIIMEEDIGNAEVAKSGSPSVSKNGSSSSGKKSGKVDRTRSSSTKSAGSGLLKKEEVVAKAKAEPQVLAKPSPRKWSPPDKQKQKQKPPRGISKGRVLAKGTPVKKTRTSPVGGAKKALDGDEDARLGSPDLGPFLLKQARDLLSSGDTAQKAADHMLKSLDLALRAGKSMEICANGKPSLELVMCLHVTAVKYGNLGRYHEAVPVLEKAIEIPVIEEGQDHALAKFASHIQLGDTYAILGQLENSIACYTTVWKSSVKRWGTRILEWPRHVDTWLKRLSKRCILTRLRSCAEWRLTSIKRTLRRRLLRRRRK